jgi:hypothetical protein
MRRAGLFVVVALTRPFDFEGRRKMEESSALVEALQDVANLVVCCAVLCCAVLRCAVLCCAVLCCAVLRCAVLCCAVQAVLCKLCCASSVHAYQQRVP